MSADAAKTPEQASLTLQAGETYVIDGLASSATPSVRVVDNPHALLLHGEAPGKLVLVGAERGRWIVRVTRKNGQSVAYDVIVNSVTTPGAPLKPGVSPAAISDAGSAGARAAESPSPAPRMGSAVALPAVAATSETDTVAAQAAPDTAAAPMVPVVPSQSMQPEAPSAESGAKFRSNPSVLANGGYTSPSVSGGRHYLPEDALVLMAGTSRVLDFRTRLTRVSIADSKIADIQVISPFQINLVGHAPGFTTLAVWDNAGNYNERQVRIDSGGLQQVMLNCTVAELDKTKIENQGINLSLALQNYGVSLVGLPGAVATPFSAQSQVNLVTPNGLQPVSIGASLPPAGQTIPMLLSQNLTYGLAAGNSNIQTQTFFQYLEQHNLAKVLAEPHLLANSGEQAKFLSGGEIPIVIAQALNTSVVFKQFGTSVEFIPTVIGRDQIELLVKPEVSQPDYTHGVQMFGFNIPAFVTRRSETMVRLHDNQTLIIAGLILHNPISTVNKVPYLGDVPYLGGLFRTTSYTNQESDLVMSVTPQLVAPLPDGGEVFLPTDRGDLTPEEIRTRDINPPDAARPRF